MIEKSKAGWAHILRTYGLTQEQYHELDKGHCQLCLRPWSDRVIPCVDHDHNTGYVRGLLCLYCNQRVLGRINDYLVGLRIYRYLKEQPKKIVVPKKPKRKIRKARK